MEDVIELNSEATNELQFRLQVDGSLTNVVKARLFCEHDDIGFVFGGKPTQDGVDIVKFVIPPMDKMDVTENTMSARVEVLVEGRNFEPINFKLKFKKPVKVVAEMISGGPLIEKKEASVTAQLVTNTKKQVPVFADTTIKAPVIESKPQKQQTEKKTLKMLWESGRLGKQR